MIDARERPIVDVDDLSGAIELRSEARANPVCGRPDPSILRVAGQQDLNMRILQSKFFPDGKPSVVTVALSHRCSSRRLIQKAENKQWLKMLECSFYF